MEPGTLDRFAYGSLIAAPERCGLLNGTTIGDLRPISVTLGEEAPCVPLRLTAIAATVDMPITVYVLGPHRAVPKNNLHAVINPRALTWPNPDLPMVSNVHETETVVGGCGRQTTEVHYPDGTIDHVDCAGRCTVGSFGSLLAPVPRAPALLRAEVTDESGPPVPLHPDDIPIADDVLRMAAAGAPSLPDDLVLREPLEVPQLTRAPSSVDGDAPSDRSEHGGCGSTPAGPRGLGALLLLLLGLLGGRVLLTSRSA